MQANERRRQRAVAADVAATDELGTTSSKIMPPLLPFLKEPRLIAARYPPSITRLRFTKCKMSPIRLLLMARFLMTTNLLSSRMVLLLLHMHRPRQRQQKRPNKKRCSPYRSHVPYHSYASVDEESS
jgi:hypothetical protein